MSADDRQQLANLRKQATSGDPEAAAQLGVWTLMGHRLPADETRGFDLLHSAASRGAVAAQRVCATLCAGGIGTDRDWPTAVGWLIAAARQGDRVAARQIGFMLDGPAEAQPTRLSLLEFAARSGDPTGQFLLAEVLRHAPYHWPDSAVAGHYRRAAAGGNPCARRRLSILRTDDTRPAKPLSLVSPEWDTIADWLPVTPWDDKPATNDPSGWKVLKERPGIRCFRRLLSVARCDYLMSVATPFLQAAPVVDSGGQFITGADYRTNRAMSFWATENDVVVQSVSDCLAGAAGYPGDNAEVLSVLHYRPGETYTSHFDFCDPELPGHAKEMTIRGQRRQTLLVYLNDDFEGGETWFNALDWGFRGNPGDGLLFDNVTPEGAPDRDTVHCGKPPQSGEKWLLSQWIRDRSQRGIGPMG